MTGNQTENKWNIYQLLDDRLFMHVSICEMLLWESRLQEPHQKPEMKSQSFMSQCHVSINVRKWIVKSQVTLGLIGAGNRIDGLAATLGSLTLAAVGL